MKIKWESTEPKRLFNAIEYTIYNNVNNIEIKCKSSRKMKEIKVAIKTTLERMNGKKEKLNNGIRK